MTWGCTLFYRNKHYFAHYRFNVSSLIQENPLTQHLLFNSRAPHIFPDNKRAFTIVCGVFRCRLMNSTDASKLTRAMSTVLQLESGKLEYCPPTPTEETGFVCRFVKFSSINFLTLRPRFRDCCSSERFRLVWPSFTCMIWNHQIPNQIVIITSTSITTHHHRRRRWPLCLGNRQDFVIIG